MDIGYWRLEIGDWKTCVITEALCRELLSKFNIKSTIADMEEQPEITQKLVIYGHDHCGQARTLVRALNQQEIEYEWRDIHNGDPTWKEELRALAKGFLSVPTVIFPDGKVMVEPWPEEVLQHLNPQPGLIKKLTNLFKRNA